LKFEQFAERSPQFFAPVARGDHDRSFHVPTESFSTPSNDLSAETKRSP
jgi:hypothetical protein